MNCKVKGGQKWPIGRQQDRHILQIFWLAIFVGYLTPWNPQWKYWAIVLSFWAGWFLLDILRDKGEK